MKKINISKKTRNPYEHKKPNSSVMVENPHYYNTSRRKKAHRERNARSENAPWSVSVSI